MKLSDDFDNEQIKSGISLGSMIVGVLFFVGVVIFAVLYVNKGKFKPNPEIIENKQQVTETQPNSTGDMEIGKSDLVSDDLDFWDMYKEDDKFIKEDAASDKLDYTEKLKELEKEEAEKAKAEDLSENGTKTEVILPDGTSQWVMINAFIEKNTYDFTGLVCEEPFMRYYANAKKSSKQGIKLDDSYGTINFKNVADAGVDYCLLRIGKRGYATGAVTYDALFSEYAKEAKENGMSVGVTFYSQAISPEEAVEEANLVVQALQNYEVQPDYPIVFEMEYVSDNENRTKDLTKQQLTDVAKAFCDTIKNYGYNPLIYGDKYWLLRKLDLTQLLGYSISLSQDGDVPDYPYQFAMWEYNHEAHIKGISQNVTMCISFIDYVMR